MLAGGCCRLIAKPSTSHPPFQPPPDKDPLGRSLLAKSLASGIRFFFVGPSRNAVDFIRKILQRFRRRKRGRNYCLLLFDGLRFYGPSKSFVPDDHGKRCSFCQSRRTIPLFLQNLGAWPRFICVQLKRVLMCPLRKTRKCLTVGLDWLKA